jgi:hypothetical protein
MMADWKRLKDMRTSQGFACTSCQLSVVVDQGKNRTKKKNKKMTSAAAAQDQHEQQQPPPPPPLDWDEEIERQMDESRRLFKEHVRSDSDRYKRQKAQWKLKKRTTTRSKKQRKVHHIKNKGGEFYRILFFSFLLKFHQNMTKRSSSSSSSESKDDDEEEEKKDDEKSETNDDDDEPEAPVERQFDEEQTRAEMIKVMEESLMPPGETMPNLSWTPNTTGNPPDVNDAR